MPVKRPNILFLMSDEHRADVTGYEGNPVVRTPVLDDLAQSGVVFRNAYTPSPICVPCRQCLAVGQLPRTCGVEQYGRDLPPFSMTFARRLSQFGYQTVCVGKLHHDGPDQMQGWIRRIAGDTRVTPRYIEGLDPTAYDALPEREHGVGKWSDAQEVRSAGYAAPGQDAERTRGALAFIDEYFLDSRYDRPSSHQPLLLKVSFSRPHYPYLTTQDKFEYYLNRVQPFLEDQPFDHPFLAQRHVKPRTDASVRDIRRATAAYYGMVEEIDEDYGRILERLREVGQNPDDWWIIYTSDHGEMLGQHGVWEKQKFFEASVRVPLIIHPPRSLRQRWGCDGRHERANVNLCDLFASLCEMAEVPLPPNDQTVNQAGLESRSLLPLMRGDVSVDAGWFDETVSQFGGTNLMIKRGALKYQFYDRDDCRRHPEVLFDLDADPTENTNFMEEPQYATAIDAFRDRRKALGW